MNMIIWFVTPGYVNFSDIVGNEEELEWLI